MFHQEFHFHYFSVIFKARSLEQMDEEFGVNSIIREEKEKQKQKVIHFHLNRLYILYFLLSEIYIK